VETLIDRWTEAHPQYRDVRHAEDQPHDHDHDHDRTDAVESDALAAAADEAEVREKELHIAAEVSALRDDEAATVDEGAPA
jgi:hypothetical protein